MFEYYRREIKRRKLGSGGVEKKRIAAMVTLKPPSGFGSSHITTMSGRSIMVGTDPTISVSEDDAEPMIANGWVRVEAVQKAV